VACGTGNAALAAAALTGSGTAAVRS